MKRSKLPAILAILSAAIFALSCSGGGNDPSTVDSTAETTAPVQEVEIIDLVSENYKIIVPENSGSEFDALCFSLRDDIKALTGKRLDVCDDWLNRNETPGEYEIIIGNTRREESSSVIGSIKYNDFRIAVIGKKLVIAGGNKNADILAINWLKENLSELFPTVSSDFEYTYHAEYKYPDMTLCGIPIGEYKIVYPDNAPFCASYSGTVCRAIGRLSGEVLPIFKESEAPSGGNTIHFGNTAGSVCSAEYGVGESYQIKATPGNVSVLAGCDNVYRGLLVDLSDILESNASITADLLDTAYSMPQRSDYMNDPDVFVPSWRNLRNVGNTTTFDEKFAILTDPTDRRICAIGHRGESEYYPENSLEGVISAYHAGAFAVEIDISKTLDGQLVLLHDDTLTRTTDFLDKRGKTFDGITLPTSESVSDWTIEQLKYLRLKCGSTLTEFPIPTLEEVLIASKNRIFLYLDKTDHYDFAADVIPLMQKTGNYRSVLIGGSGVNYQTCVSRQKKIFDMSGEIALIYCRANNNEAPTVSRYMANNALAGNIILLCGEYFTNNSSYLYSTIRALPATRFGCWTLNTPQTESAWHEIYGLGFRIIMADKLFDLLEFSGKPQYN